MTQNTALTRVDASQIDLTDMLDDQQALATVKESILEDFVYKVQGELRLSKKGAEWACREYAKRAEILEVIDHPKVETDPVDPEYVLVTVLAQRATIVDGKKIPLDTNIGAKREWRKLKLADDYQGRMGKPGDVVDNPFWFEHAVGKAQRNAKLGLMESDFIAKMIEAWQGKKGKGGRSPASSQQPAKESPVEAARKAAAQKPAPAAQSKAAPSGELSTPQTRQRLMGLLAVVGFGTDQEKKDAFLQLLPGRSSSKETPEAVLNSLIEALRSVKDGQSKMNFDSEGKAQILGANGQVVYPV